MKVKSIILLLFSAFVLVGCFDDRDDNGVLASEINDFVWKGMNAVYLYKEFIPDLQNDRFTTNQEYTDYLSNSGSPEQLFESLIYQRPTIDRFSWIVDDYIALEQQLSGTSVNNGLKYGIRRVPGSETAVYGYVRLVLPNSNAEGAGLQRGDIFDKVDGIALTEDNFRTLLSPDSYTLNLAEYDDNGTQDISDDQIISGSESVILTKVPYTENPIFISDIFDIGGENVGYLMYNRFLNDFDSQLNNVFGNFKSNNVQHLVLDLRYNPGGRVSTAINLSSLITGQFTGQIFSTEEWNSELQQAFEQQNPEALKNYFVDNIDGTALNSLNLNKVYILTTGSSASASELVINALDPYITVVQLGTTTVGKYQASFTVYDSPDLGRPGANPNHTYAMQPLVLKEVNAAGNTDFDSGLMPNIEIGEVITNLGVLGDENEPLLAAALAEIEGTRVSIPLIHPIDLIGDNYDLEPFAKEMYVDKTIPISIKSNLQNQD